MKIFTFILLFPTLALASSDTVFVGFDRYYLTLPNRLFQGNPVKLAMMYTNNLTYSWEGSVEGKEHKIVVHQGDDEEDSVFIDGQFINPKQVKKFPGLTGSVFNLTYQGGVPVVFFASNWACLQYDEPDVALDHRPVYLVSFPNTANGRKQNIKILSLPVRHASCLQIRMKNGQIMFDSVEYRYNKEGARIGASFFEYTIHREEFVRTKTPPRNVTFVEPPTAFKFTLDE